MEDSENLLLNAIAKIVKESETKEDVAVNIFSYLSLNYYLVNASSGSEPEIGEDELYIGIEDDLHQILMQNKG